MRCAIATGATVLALAAPVAAQMPTNPTGVQWDCPDHATDDGHEIDIVRVSDGVVIQTLDVGDPPALAGITVQASVNVMPVAHDIYRFVVRALAGTLASVDSEPSIDWARVPGRPSNVVVQ